MFKGQPKGLFALALANTGERFGYYTMLAIFLLFIQAKFGFSAAAAKSPEMGVAAMAISFVVVPVVSLLTKNKPADQERIEDIFTCYT